MPPATRPRSIALVLALVGCTVGGADPQSTGFGSDPSQGGTPPTGDGGSEDGSSAGTSTGSESSADGDGTASSEPDSSDASSTTGASACSPVTCITPSTCVDDECLAPQKPAPGEVIIVELMIDPVTLSDNFAEWIEVLNVGAVAVDLDGCRLLDLGVNGDDHVIDAGEPLVLLPGGMLLLGKSTSAADNGTIPVDYAYGEFGVSLTNTGDDLILRCDDLDIDQVGWAADTWPYDVGVAMQLDPGEPNGVANDAPTAWCAATNVYSAGNTGTPRAANTPCP